VTLLLTAIIPIYLKSVGRGFGLSDAVTTAHWGVVNSGATLILAFLAPVIGAVADFKGNKNGFSTSSSRWASSRCFPPSCSTIIMRCWPRIL
jgi:MFS-type transporter involved in bile tolerance (Atg22 family)